VAGEVILIVEDNDVLRHGLEALLQSEGYVAVTAAHGYDALDRMAISVPDLILSDISMPEMDGYQFYEAVRARSAWVSIPFIFLTARRGRDEIFTGKRLGVEDYLVKPVTRKELTTTIRSRLARNQQLLFVQLQQAYASSLIMLANAIELRDQGTRNHVERVRDIALLIGRQVGWKDEQLRNLEYGSILHDVGKIHIPESVIKKPAKLNDEEWELMRRHPSIGVEIIKEIQYLAAAIPVIRSHHERWDGSGYPQGLAGEAIPLAARIVAVADSVDAMCATRPYQQGIAPEQAYQQILVESGRLYDPIVVEAFKAAWPAILERLREDAHQ
jgi:putative two-component system response regulator